MMQRIEAPVLQVTEQIQNHLTSLFELLAVKTAEYSRNGDGFWNFNQAATLVNEDPRVSLFGFMTKHLISITDYRDNFIAEELVEPKKLNEKINDMIIYLSLLKIMNERHYEYNAKQQSITVAAES